MAEGKFIAYYRVSTRRQGRSGLGLEAQQRAVADYLNGGSWKLVEEFTEVESGKRTDRPVLAQALAACRVHRATLVIAKLDRLARDAHFLLGLQKEGVPFRAADMPEANEMVVGIMAVVAQAERKMISERTKAALAAAKRRGVKLGGRPENLKRSSIGRKRSAAARAAAAEAAAADLLPIILAIRESGIVTLGGIAGELNGRGIGAPRGGQWRSTQILRVLERASRA
jgi:DNA invertase Pin-like site-specific DNA recombinase